MRSGAEGGRGEEEGYQYASQGIEGDSVKRTGEDDSSRASPAVRKRPKMKREEGERNKVSFPSLLQRFRFR
jgi:hypothetical protein